MNWQDKTIQEQEGKYYRTKAQFDTKEEASKITEEEKSHPYVDLHYLKAFSLVYHINPYEILGIKNPHMVDPLGSIDDPCYKYCNVIFNTLYDKDDPLKLDYLRAIALIGRMKLYRQHTEIKKRYSTEN